jgi:hypothetical protein
MGGDARVVTGLLERLKLALETRIFKVVHAIEKNVLTVRDFEPFDLFRKRGHAARRLREERLLGAFDRPHALVSTV